jgi:hypothetical protein
MRRSSQFDLRAELFRMTGTDLTQIDEIDVTTTMTIRSEVGWDMSKWKTEHHFVSWLRLCPDNRISGDKIMERAIADQQWSHQCIEMRDHIHRPRSRVLRRPAPQTPN